jgi:UDP-N-acetylmuramate--alanine ligase
VGETRSGAVVVDDYAHHPTEVAATLAAARERVSPGGRVVAAFQPHLFSRTKRNAVAFGRALAAADVVCLLDVYPARERAEDFAGVSGLTVAREVPRSEVLWAPAFPAAERLLGARLRRGDLCVVMGAGSSTELARRLVDA